MPRHLCNDICRAPLIDTYFVEGKKALEIAVVMLDCRVSSNLMGVTAGHPKHFASDVTDNIQCKLLPAAHT